MSGCGAPARTIRAPAFEGKSFKCPNCRDYDVSKSVLERGLLRKLDRAQRRDVLERARKGAAPNTRPVITSYIL